jgi:NAD(P)-dependent dehydrogenase (short-subunit alcohol dehydrogenase family)
MSDNGIFTLNGKVAAIIGAGSGIGAAVAAGAARQGAAVVCLDSNHAAADATASSIGGSASAAAVDIRDAKGVTAAFDAIVRERGRLDIVAHAEHQRAQDLQSVEEFDRSSP